MEHRLDSGSEAATLTRPGPQTSPQNEGHRRICRLTPTLLSGLRALGLALIVSSCGISSPSARKPVTAADRLQKEGQLLMQREANFQSSACMTDHSDPQWIIAWTDPAPQEEYTVTIDSESLTWRADYAFVGGREIENEGVVSSDLRTASLGSGQPGAATADGPHSDHAVNLACNILYFTSGRQGADLLEVQFETCEAEFGDSAANGFQACLDQLRASPSPGLGE